MSKQGQKCLEAACGKPLSEAEYLAASRNLSAFFDILHEWKSQNNERLQANDEY